MWYFLYDYFIIYHLINVVKPNFIISTFQYKVISAFSINFSCVFLLAMYMVFITERLFMKEAHVCLLVGFVSIPFIKRTFFVVFFSLNNNVYQSNMYFICVNQRTTIVFIHKQMSLKNQLCILYPQLPAHMDE